MTHPINQNSVWNSTKRIETLVDGVFAIAMTLLVLNIDVPQILGHVSDAELMQYVIDLMGQLLIYAFSFILLATFWRINHQQFYWINKADTAVVWINIFWLMFVALVPFSTNFVSDYGSHQIPMVFFNLNMFFIGLFFNLNWYYTNRKGYLDESLDKARIDYVQKVNLILPITSLIAIFVTFIDPTWSPFCYFLIFFAKRSL